MLKRNTTATLTYPTTTTYTLNSMPPTLTSIPIKETSTRTTLTILTTQNCNSVHLQSLADCCSKAITARSRRRRRRPLPIACHISTAKNTSVRIHPASASLKYHLSKLAQSTRSGIDIAAQTLSKTVTIATYVALLLLSATCSLCNASPCDSQNWWDPVRDKCIPCTLCKGDMIPLRPCQLHRDTYCGSIYDLKIDWVVLAKTEPNWKERRKSDDISFHLEQQLTHEELQQLHEESLPMDWQTAALFMAVLACLLFFIVAACILVQHMRQWRRMERRLDQDVEELSTKLMAKLAEVQSLEGGTFFIGNADALRVPTTFQPQHVLLPEKPAKHHDRRILKPLQPGNVYIEENGS